MGHQGGKQAMPASTLKAWGPWRSLRAVGSSQHVPLPRTGLFRGQAQRTHDVLLVFWTGQWLTSEGRRQRAPGLPAGCPRPHRR